MCWDHGGYRVPCAHEANEPEGEGPEDVGNFRWEVNMVARGPWQRARCQQSRVKNILIWCSEPFWGVENDGLRINLSEFVHAHR